jgi:hypothetical protein
MQTTDHPYLVTLARDHTLKLHRSTCKKANANASATPTDQFDASLNGNVATPATCCKPRPLPAPDVPDAEPAPAEIPDVRPAPEAVPDSRPAKATVAVRFMRAAAEGKPLRPMQDSQNKLASIAYYHTDGLIAGQPRCSTHHLRAILWNAGIKAPEAAPWGPITLANGVVLQAVAL